MTEDLRQHIIELFGLPYEDTEEGRAEFTSYLQARAEADTQRDAYVAWAETRRAEIADQVTARGHAEGWLPEGTRFEWAPTDDTRERQ